MARTPYIRHLKHAEADRVRHSDRLQAWLNAQATRLQVTVAEVFDMLRNGSAQEVENVPTPAP